MMGKIAKAAALACVCAVCLTGCTAKNTQQSLSTKPLSTEEGMLQTNAVKLQKQLVHDSLESLKQAYEGKRIQIIGQITDKWLMDDGTICVSFGQQKNELSEYYAVRIIFDIAQRDMVNKLNVGDFIVVKGTGYLYEPVENKEQSLFFDLYNVTIE